jgi:ribosomal protein L7/L12
VLGLAVMSSERGVCLLVGSAIFVLSVLVNPARWWQYVLTGAKTQSPPAAELSEPGAWGVELRNSGARPVEVIKAIREVTWAAFPEAETQVQGAPATIAENRSEGSARRVRDRIERAGATASIVTSDAS